MENKEQSNEALKPTVETPKAEAVKPVEAKAEVVAPKATFMEKISNMFQANTVIKDLRAEVNQLATALGESQNAFKNLQDMAQGEVEMKASYEKQLADMKADYKAKLADMTLDTQLTDEKVQVKASQILANIGIEPGEIEATIPTEATSPQAKLSHFKTLTGVAKSDFYKNNRRDILHASNEIVTQTK